MVDIEGIVRVSAYDIDGSILAVDIVDSTGNAYLVADNQMGISLLNSVGEKVYVQGELSQDSFGTLLTIKKFQKVASF